MAANYRPPPRFEGKDVMTSRTLYRQIHQSWIVDGKVTSQAFSPTPKDHKRLSVNDGNVVSAKEAWQHHSVDYESVGVMAVTEDECKLHNLQVVSDVISYTGHMVIVFEGLSRNKAKTAARYLKKCANKRGWCYRPTATEPTL